MNAEPYSIVRRSCLGARHPKFRGRGRGLARPGEIRVALLPEGGELPDAIGVRGGEVMLLRPVAGEVV